ncbi:uncharacterized protein TM35_000111580 [Trypanosoma theileri]|uniref:Uncharacterized protein n=1 Tax=Trypanosoma theileri TaxID=67003 RepID=A0A1X0NY66_9TRYP|nr:uncharacterized protein TM35_000111580 [Trypanosoma theileri]ORC89624.1 hypothetical protein TM35_000111580 [Trypanosoma theileri]
MKSTASPLVHFRQRSLTFGDEKSLLHLSQQCFADCVWILLTEDDSCTPGVVLRSDPHESGPVSGGNSRWAGEASMPATPCECLLGLRDHPLTNVLASAVAGAIQQQGERRPVLMCISVGKTARRLQTAADRMAFVRAVKDEVLMLATGAA